MKYVVRKSDGKKFAVIGRVDDEIQIKERYPFWTPNGTKIKYLKLWHNIKDYEEVK